MLDSGECTHTPEQPGHSEGACYRAMINSGIKEIYVLPLS